MQTNTGRTELTKPHDIPLQTKEGKVRSNFIGYSLTLINHYSGLYTELLLCNALFNEIVIAYKTTEVDSLFQEIELLVSTERETLTDAHTNHELRKIATEAKATHPKLHNLLDSVKANTYSDKLSALVELLEGYFKEIFGMYNSLDGTEPIEFEL